MKLAEIVSSLGLQVLSGGEGLQKDVSGGCVSDLLSYVMGNAKRGNVWITLHGHPNIVGVAELLNLAAVIIADGQDPEPATLKKAAERGVVLLASEETAFEVAGRLYALGVR